MAIAFKGAADLGNNGGGVSGYTAAYTVNAASTLLVIGFAGDTATDDITGVTYNGVACKLCAKKLGDRWAYMYCLSGPATGTHNIVITSSSNKLIILLAADYSGVFVSANQPEATITGFKAAPGADTLTVTLTTLSDNDWTVLLSQGFNGNAPPLAGAGSTVRVVDAAFGDVGIFDSNGAITPPAATSMNWNRASSGHVMASVMAAFSPTAPIAAVGVRVSQNMAEVLAPPVAGNARVSQVMVEVLHSLGVLQGVGTSGHWFKDLDESALFDDRDLVD